MCVAPFKKPNLLYIVHNGGKYFWKESVKITKHPNTEKNISLAISQDRITSTRKFFFKEDR